MDLAFSEFMDPMQVMRSGHATIWRENQRKPFRQFVDTDLTLDSYWA